MNTRKLAQALRQLADHLDVWPVGTVTQFDMQDAEYRSDEGIPYVESTITAKFIINEDE